MLSRLTPRATTVTTVVGSVLICAYLWLVVDSAGRTTYAVWGGLVLVPVLILANVPLLLRAGRRDPDPRFVKVLMWAFVVKCLASLARYLMAFVLYDGNADSASFDDEGQRLSQEYLDGNFGADIGRDFIGTGFMRVATGVLYTVTGPSLYVAWAVCSMFSFWGCYYLYRAFRVSLPGGDARRYAFLVLLLPSMLFWPSSLGKESLVVFGLGLACYGSALLLTGYRTWMVPLIAGLAVTAVIRPHITAAVFAALAAAWFLRRRTRPADELTPLTYVGGMAAIVASGGVIASFAATFLDVDASLSGVQSAISETTELTNEGGSTFSPATVHNPLDLPWAFFTVVFRPMVIEASNPQMLLAAAEGSLLLLLIALSWRSLIRVPGQLRRQPYLIFCIVYALVFAYAFSNFGNFGILTRQRVQVLPFVLVFLALRPPRRPPEPEPEPTSVREEEEALT